MLIKESETGALPIPTTIIIPSILMYDRFAVSPIEVNERLLLQLKGSFPEIEHSLWLDAVKINPSSL